MLIGNSNFYNGKNSFATNATGTSNAKNQANQSTSKLSVATDIPNSEPRNKGIDRSIEAPDLDKGSNSFKAVLPPNTLNPPNFPKSLYDSLPDFFKRVIKYADGKDEKDILLLSSIVTTGSCLTKISGEYDHAKLHPNLNLFVSGAASSGKGRIRFSEKLVQPIHQELRQKTLKEKEQFKTVVYSMGKGKSEKKEENEVKDVPTQKMLLIPGNATSSRMQELLHNNQGKGLIFETEGDVMVNSFKSDYGDYSTIFRQAFHHEKISLTRKGNDEHIEIPNPKLSVVLSGTPLQLKALLPNVENGLFSRFMFYKLRTNSEWKNVFNSKGKGGLNKHFEQLGDEFFEFYKALESQEEIEFVLTQDQQHQFNDFFAKHSKRYEALLGTDFLSILRRIGVIGFRIAMVMSFFRVQEERTPKEQIICKDIDFKNALIIIDTLISHSALIFSQTPKAPKPRLVKTREQELLELLPLQFSRQDFYACAEKLKISKKASDKLISKLTKSNWIQRRTHGEYVNASKLKPTLE